MGTHLQLRVWIMVVLSRMVAQEHRLGSRKIVAIAGESLYDFNA